MKVHEYQARQLLADAGVPVPPAVVVETSQDAQRAYDRLTSRDGARRCVVKAQIHAGGRGKGGGVKIVCSAQEAYDAAYQILSKPLVTPQTGPRDTCRLFLAALRLSEPGVHILQASGDVQGQHFPNTRVRELLGWEPRGE